MLVPMGLGELGLSAVSVMGHQSGGSTLAGHGQALSVRTLQRPGGGRKDRAALHRGLLYLPPGDSAQSQINVGLISAFARGRE